MQRVERKLTVSGEKLDSMSQEELDDLYSNLGSLGLTHELSERSISYVPDAFPVSEEARLQLKNASYADFQSFANQIDQSEGFATRTWLLLVRYSNGLEDPHSWGDHPIIKEADEPLYEVDTSTVLGELQRIGAKKAAATLENELKWLQRQSTKYIDTKELIEAIEDKTLQNFPGAGKATLDFLVDFATNQIKLSTPSE